MYWSGCDRRKDHGLRLSVGRGCDRRKDHGPFSGRVVIAVRITDQVLVGW